MNGSGDMGCCMIVLTGAQIAEVFAGMYEEVFTANESIAEVLPGLDFVCLGAPIVCHTNDLRRGCFAVSA